MNLFIPTSIENKQNITYEIYNIDRGNMILSSVLIKLYQFFYIYIVLINF